MIHFDHTRLVPPHSEPIAITIVGIGGAGSNALDRIVLDGADGAEIVAMNTDAQSLTGSVARMKVQLGRAATRGLGAGGDPDLGQSAAEEAADEIRKAVEGAGMVFICVGLGGGTGSGAAPLVANVAKDQGALVIVFATMPFAFEGKRRAKQAEDALVALEAAADAVICFENDTMGDAVSPKAGIQQAFAAADETVSQSVRAISQLFARPGILHIGLDDLRAALRTTAAGAGRCLFGFGEAGGDNRAYEALSRALKNPLMDRGRMLEDAHNVLVNVTGGPEMTLNEVQILMDELGKHTGPQTQILFGTAVDPKMGERLSVTILSSTSIAAAVEEPASVAARRVAPPTQRPVEIAPAPLGNGNERHAPPASRAEDSEESEEQHAPAAAAIVAEAEREDEEADLLDIPMEMPVTLVAPAHEPPTAAPAPMPVHRERIAAKAARPEPPAPVIPAPAPKREERQETLQFEPVTRGRFEKSEPTIVDGQDLDVPTFLRRNIRVR